MGYKSTYDLFKKIGLFEEDEEEKEEKKEPSSSKDSSSTYNLFNKVGVFEEKKPGKLESIKNAVVDYYTDNTDKDIADPNYTIAEKLVGVAFGANPLLIVPAAIGGLKKDGLEGMNKGLSTALTEVGPAFAAEGADSIAGWTIGAYETIGNVIKNKKEDLLRDHSTLSTLFDLTPLGMIANTAPLEGTRREMLNNVSNKIEFAAQELKDSSDINKTYVRALDTGMQIGAGMIGGAGTGAIAKGAGVTSKYARIIYSTGEGMLQGIGDNPELPVVGATIGGGLALGGSVVGETIGSAIKDRKANKALSQIVQKTKTDYLKPEKEVLANPSLYGIDLDFARPPVESFHSIDTKIGNKTTKQRITGFYDQPVADKLLNMNLDELRNYAKQHYSSMNASYIDEASQAQLLDRMYDIDMKDALVVHATDNMSIDFIQNLEERLKSLSPEVIDPPTPLKTIGTQLAETTDSYDSELKRKLIKFTSMFKSLGSIGGFRKSQSFLLAARDFTDTKVKDFVKNTLPRIILGQKGDASALVEKFNNKLLALDDAIIDYTSRKNISIRDYRKELKRLISERLVDTIEDPAVKSALKNIQKDFKQMGEEYIRAGALRSSSMAILYRAENYLHTGYLSSGMKFQDFIKDRALHDPKTFKQAISLYKQRIIEDIEWERDTSISKIMEDESLTDEARSIAIEDITNQTSTLLKNHEELNNRAIGAIAKRLLPEATEASSTSAIAEKRLTGSLETDVLKTTQGRLEKGWTSYLFGKIHELETPERILISKSLETNPNRQTRLEYFGAAEDLINNPIKTDVDKAGNVISYRADIDTTFEPFLDKVVKNPEAIRRILNRYTNSIVERAMAVAKVTKKGSSKYKGIPKLNKGKKINYNDVRQLVDEETREFLFRQALREEDTPEVLGKLMGVKEDVRDALVETYGILSHNQSIMNMFKQIHSDGVRLGLFSEKEFGKYNRQISNPTSLGLTGHNQVFKDLYTTPELADVITGSVEAADHLNWLFQVNNVLKAGKVLNPASVARNLTSSLLTYVANGDMYRFKGFNLSGLKDIRGAEAVALKAILGNDQSTALRLMQNSKTAKAVFNIFGIDELTLRSEDFQEDVIDMIKRGVLQGGSGAEMEEVANLAAKQAAGMLDEGDANFHKLISKMSRFYQSPDMFVKTLAYRARITDLAWAEGIDLKQLKRGDSLLEKLKDQAAEMVNESYQTYDRTPMIAKNLSKNPFGPSFINFPVESLRNFKNIVKETSDYLAIGHTAFQDGDRGKALRYAGLASRKLAGIMTLTAGIPTMIKTWNEMVFGVDDEKLETLSEFVQFPGQKGIYPIITDYDEEKKKIKFVDLGGVHPFPFLSAAHIFGLLSKGENDDLSIDFQTAIDELQSIYLPMGLIPKAAGEALTGRSIKTYSDFLGSYSYVDDPNAPGALPGMSADQQKLGKTLYRFYRNVTPAIGTQAENIARAIADDPLGSRDYSLSGELLYQTTGMRESEADINKAVMYAFRDHKDQIASTRKNWKNALKNLSTGDYVSYVKLRKQHQEELTTSLNKLIYYKREMESLGYKAKEIDSILDKMNYGDQTGTVFTKTLRNAIINENPDVSIDILWQFRED